MKVSVTIIRAFVQFKELLSTHRELAAKLAQLERKLEGHDGAIANLFEAMRQLLSPSGPTHGRKIGFGAGKHETWGKLGRLFILNRPLFIVHWVRPNEH